MSFYSQEFTHLLVKKSDNVLWLTLNNSAQRNAITLEMVESLSKVLKHADFDSEIKVIAITGAGEHFCAGGDVKAMQTQTGMFAGDSYELRMRYMHGIQQIPKMIEDLSKPLVALVNGAAIGAGCDLAMMCDIRLGSPATKFGETFVKLGLVPGIGGSFFLQRVVGYAKAMELSLTGDILSGEEALKFGMLNKCVPESELLAETNKIINKIAVNSGPAVQMTKKAMKIAYRSEMAALLDLAAAYQGIAQRTPEHKLAIQDK